MATSAHRSRIFPARSKKSYRLEMEGRTLYLLLTLMVLTGVVVFYLGIVTGKAMRDPNNTVALSAQLRTPGAAAVEDGKTLTRQGFAFNSALKTQDPLIEGLKTEEEKATLRTQDLLKRGERQLELKEITTPSAALLSSAPSSTAPRIPASTSPARQGIPTPAQPIAPKIATRAPGSTALPGDLYTVQVFTSRYEKNARELVNRLRNQGFSAYLNRYQSSQNKVLYRVRVGRTSRADADILMRRLRTEANLKEPQIRKL